MTTRRATDAEDHPANPDDDEQMVRLTIAELAALIDDGTAAALGLLPAATRAFMKALAAEYPDDPVVGGFAAGATFDQIFSGPRHTNPGRPRDEGIRDALAAIVAAAAPCTVRQAFYLSMVRGLVPKTEAGYKKVGRLLVEMRLDGTVPWAHLADNTRWQRKPSTHNGLDDAVAWWAAGYRRDLVPALGRVEIWLEKDALAGVIYPVTAEWTVPLMVTRGYASVSFLHTAAESWETGANCYDPMTVYYLGDHDPSGRDIDRNTEDRLRQFAPETDLTFSRIAVTEQQIALWHLPGRPTKRTDTRARDWQGDSVELDAIPPDTLRDLVRAAIESHIDTEQLERIRTVEAAERESIHEFVKTVRATHSAGAT